MSHRARPESSSSEWVIDHGISHPVHDESSSTWWVIKHGMSHWVHDESSRMARVIEYMMNHRLQYKSSSSEWVIEHSMSHRVRDESSSFCCRDLFRQLVIVFFRLFLHFFRLRTDASTSVLDIFHRRVVVVVVFYFLRFRRSICKLLVQKSHVKWFYIRRVSVNSWLATIVQCIPVMLSVFYCKVTLPYHVILLRLCKSISCWLRGCKNWAHSVSWPEVVKAIPNQGLDCFVS